MEKMKDHFTLTFKATCIYRYDLLSMVITVMNI